MNPRFAAHLDSYSALLRHLREWFWHQDILEVDTPLLSIQGDIETHLDCLTVNRRAPRKSVEIAPDRSAPGYLVTSPEFALKQLVAQSRRSLFQLAHSFRDGDVGGWHTEEFLMLEWYLVESDLEALMDFCDRFFASLSVLPFVHHRFRPAVRRAIPELFREHLGIDLQAASLAAAAVERRLLTRQQADRYAYDDLFFLLFLNAIEPILSEIGDGQPVYVYHYPPELAAFSQVRSGWARRFEIYWRGVELANGYEELRSRQEYEAAFARELHHRHRLGKPSGCVDQRWLAVLTDCDGLPFCSGIALGFERLLAILLQSDGLGAISPFAR
ncbi:MAG: hypothetical protein KDK39_10515 [Leptospiraceae bacterium]|nr:hypothetical protein [Leptospiraceae bacterium]